MWYYPPILKDGDNHDRSEGLFFSKHHVILDVSEDGWLHEVALCVCERESINALSIDMEHGGMQKWRSSS